MLGEESGYSSATGKVRALGTDDKYQVCGVQGAAKNVLEVLGMES
jgi:hypothetical protein